MAQWDFKWVRMTPRPRGSERVGPMPPLGKVLLALLALMTLWTAAPARVLTAEPDLGTPAGTYALAITATSGTATRTLALTLIVQ
jgi:hypothetical protein